MRYNYFCIKTEIKRSNNEKLSGFFRILFPPLKFPFLFCDVVVALTLFNQNKIKGQSVLGGCRFLDKTKQSTRFDYYRGGNSIIEGKLLGSCFVKEREREILYFH